MFFGLPQTLFTIDVRPSQAFWLKNISIHQRISQNDIGSSQDSKILILKNNVRPSNITTRFVWHNKQHNCRPCLRENFWCLVVDGNHAFEPFEASDIFRL